MVLTSAVTSLALAVAMAASPAEIVPDPLASADACLGGGSCALELSQLRALKRHGSEQSPAPTTPFAAQDVPVAADPLALPSWTQTCGKVFLDLGSNIGVNVRKFYEAEKYPGSPLLPLFDRLFGSVDARRSDASVCAFGFEPNPEHRARLMELERSYATNNFRVHFFEAAAWRDNGFMALNLTGQRGVVEGDRTNLGAHLSMKSQAYPGSHEVMVRTMDVSKFVQALPQGSATLIAMDIEGAEYEVLAKLMQDGVMCESKIKSAVLEAHEWGDITNWGDAATFDPDVHPRSFQGVQQRLRQLTEFGWCSPAAVSEVQELDDETYAADVDDRFADFSPGALAAVQEIRSVTQHGDEKARQTKFDYGHPAWLQDCKAIYLDVGSNVGVNVRKLFEPARYPGARLLEHFQERFGAAELRAAPAEQSGICALGLEPNPEHQARLRQLEQDYAQRGWRAHFYPLAAWSGDGFMLFNTTGNRAPRPEDTTHSGAHLQQHFPTWPGARQVSVKTANLASLIRELPPNTVKFMTMDIEGAEYETLAGLMQGGVFCEGVLPKVALEAHEWGEITNWGTAETFADHVHPRSFEAILQRASQVQDMDWCNPGKVSPVELLDDETYTADVPDAAQ